MEVVLLGLGILLAGGAAALVVPARPGFSIRVGSAGAIAGCAVGFAGTVVILLRGSSPSLRLPWDVPYGELHIEIDPLSAFFLLPLFGLGLLAALYGMEYMRHHEGRRWLGPPAFFYNLLLASIALVILARNGVLFLVAWELMALSSFFLVTFEDEREEVRDAGWIYLVASHVGTAFLLALFVLLARGSGSMDFHDWSGMPGLPPVTGGILFLLAVVGFGTKAGIVPFHIWLPEAHPAAPSHVSALMSGVMIKTGIYGLMRTLTFLGPAPSWWGILLLVIGIASGVLGVLYALAQHDLKRLLAYHSVENIGIIVLGMGIGMLGLSYGSPALAILGFAGSLLHVLNHAIFKGLLFLGAGAVIHETGTREIDHLGGLIRRMPVTGATFVVGAAAISGLPPFNGFLSEFLVYVASFQGVVSLQGARVLAPLSVLVGMALIGSLAAACFAKVFGAVFLGSARSERPSRAREAGGLMRSAMIALAALCALLGLLPWIAFSIVRPAARLMAGAGSAPSEDPLGLAGAQANGIALVLLALIVAAGALVILRRRALARREVREGLTWDCGYVLPTSRMQYTASSFAEPVLEMFSLVLPGRRQLVPPEGCFPRSASFRSSLGRPFQERVYRPAFAAVNQGLLRLRWLHHGRIQLYVLYIVLTLVVMLVWFISQ